MQSCLAILPLKLETTAIAVTKQTQEPTMKLNNTQKKVMDILDQNNGELPKAWMLGVQIREAKKLVILNILAETDTTFKHPCLG